jgi:hypothetical protein
VKLSKILTQLERWISIRKINIKISLVKENIEELNIELQYINQHHKTYIDATQSKWLQELIEDLKGWWKIIYTRRISEIEILKRKEIEEYTERRCQMIGDNQGKMLRSLLDKPSKRIQIDRLIEENNNRRKLLIEPLEVLTRTKEHFQNQLRARHFKKEILKREWEEIYKPKDSIDRNWYKSINQNITEEE